MQQNISIKNDVFTLAPNQAREFRRHRSGVTRERGLQAVAHYLYFRKNGGKRPFLHDGQSRIVSPVCPEVFQWLKESMGIKLDPSADSWWWSRQRMRSQRRARGGRKYYPRVIGERIAEKRLLRGLRKQRLALEATPLIQMQSVQTPIAPKLTSLAVYGNTPAWYVRIPNGTLVMVLFNGTKDLEDAVVYHIEKNGVAAEKPKGSPSQRYHEDVLRQKGWKLGKLGDPDLAPILALLK
jgi:hypothetical protein